MLNKIITATVMVVLVLYFGDPYAPENQGKVPWLPPTFDDAELLAFKKKSSDFIENIDLETGFETISNSELTHDVLFFFSELRIKVLHYLIELGQEQEMLAQARENE